MGRRATPTWHKTARWCFTYTTPEGTRKTVYDKAGLRKTEKSRAREWMETTKEALQERVVVGGDWTVHDLRLAYLSWLKPQVAKGVFKPLTFEGHQKQLRQVCQAKIGDRPFGALIARDLGAKHVDALIRAWSGKNPTTIRNRLASLQVILNWAAKPITDRAIEKLIPANPLVGMKLPAAVHRDGRGIPPEDIAPFVKFVHDRAQEAQGNTARFARMLSLLIRVAAESGCRPGELCAAKWEHFRAEQRSIVLSPKEHKTGAKTGKSRWIVLPPEFVPEIEALRADPHAHPLYLFTHRTHGDPGTLTKAERLQGSPWNSSKLSLAVKRLRHAAEIAGVIPARKGHERITMYNLRHSFATAAYHRGVDPNDGSALIGNSPRVFTDTYVHTDATHYHRISDKARGQ